jgi:hypothetical protein
MRVTDVHGDIDSNTVGDEGVDHCTVGRRHRFGSGAALDRAGERGCVGRGSRAGPSMRQLPEVPHQHDGAAGDQQDHGVQRQQLSIISTSAHFPPPNVESGVGGKEANPGPPADQSSVDSTGATAATDWP